jgi:hypothetical protein
VFIDPSIIRVYLLEACQETLFSETSLCSRLCRLISIFGSEAGRLVEVFDTTLLSIGVSRNKISRMDFFLRCVRSTWEVVVAAQTKLNWRRNCHFHTTGDHLRLQSPMNDSEAGPSTGVTENFDVFLNHRGPDLKATFVAHLVEALRDRGLRPFLDRQALEVGNPNQESIYQALDMAKVHVAVVSKGYAESQYYLDELVAMKRSHKPVIPLFYDVKPNDMRWVEEGKFAEAFEKHEGRQTPEKLQEWTDALGWLADFGGVRFDTTCKDR